MLHRSLCDGGRRGGVMPCGGEESHPKCANLGMLQHFKKHSGGLVHTRLLIAGGSCIHRTDSKACAAAIGTVFEVVTGSPAGNATEHPAATLQRHPTDLR